MKNPLLDFNFLSDLHEYTQRETFARVTLLDNQEQPIEYIEGKITQGSISIDGNSALRRTCNLTLVLKDQNQINQFNWTFKHKFKLEVGLRNFINPDYPEIIWFPQGIFILTTCNMNQTTNNYTITINGKDKMCKLNGDLGGNLSAATDFGTLEEIDADGNITYTKLLLKDIIREMLINQGGELAENIIINDLDEAGLELLEYRCDTKPLYLFRNVDTEEVINITLDETTEIKKVGETESITLDDLIPEELVILNNLFLDTTDAVKVQLKTTSTSSGWTNEKYQIIKYTYGDLAGYRVTDLTYAGELKANIGETIVSVLDKIAKMLGQFEYFYNLDGRFVFQKKHKYVSVPWGGSESATKDDKENELLWDTYPLINLTNAKAITAFANNPNLLNVKNDFSRKEL